jgi:membrane-anchored protein YejM (alkaline phosphatase superfamily)
MPARRQALRWTGWFTVANAGMYGIVGLRYFATYSFDPDPLGLIYTVLAYAGHFALLAALPIGLFILPLALLVPRRAWIMAPAAIVAGLSLALLVLDTNVFAEQRYHLTPFIVLLFGGQTWIFVAVIAVVAVAFELLVAGSVWRWVEKRPTRRGRLVAALLCLSWVASQGIHVWADAIGHTPVTQLTRYLPAYFPVHAKRKLARWGLVDPLAVERQRTLSRTGTATGGQLRYPLRPLRCETPARPSNLLIVLLDALRPDAIDPALMPNLAALRGEGSDFANHWSGGNSSRAGIFSMFYGLPSTYADAFYGVQQAPVLMSRIRDLGYQLALFAASGFTAPTDIERTVFAGIPGLPGERRDLGAVERNRAVTEQWLSWLAGRRPTRPFFGFLYYDPPMSDMSADTAAPLPMDDRFLTNERAHTAWRRYRLAARFLDGELRRVLASLRAAALLDETVILVVSDHGYEFDDNGLGYVGHASTYSPAQLRATLVVHWPGRPPATYEHRSSHYDIPATLLADLLGCANDPADYSVGRNLFSGRSWDWIIAGSYNSHAIVEPDRLIVSHPGGLVEILGPDYRPLRDARVDTSVVEAAVADMRRFYR